MLDASHLANTPALKILHAPHPVSHLATIPWSLHKLLIFNFLSRSHPLSTQLTNGHCFYTFPLRLHFFNLILNWTQMLSWSWHLFLQLLAVDVFISLGCQSWLYFKSNHIQWSPARTWEVVDCHANCVNHGNRGNANLLQCEGQLLMLSAWEHFPQNVFFLCSFAEKGLYIPPSFNFQNFPDSSLSSIC